MSINTAGITKTKEEVIDNGYSIGIKKNIERVSNTYWTPLEKKKK